MLGDDLYAHQPFCELLTKVGGVSQLTERHHNGARRVVWQYRDTPRVPLRADMQPLYVNWCEVTISDEATASAASPSCWSC